MRAQRQECKDARTPGPDINVNGHTICWHEKTGLYILPGSYKQDSVFVGRDVAIRLYRKMLG